MEKENPFSPETIIYIADVGSHTIREQTLGKMVLKSDYEIKDGNCIDLKRLSYGGKIANAIVNHTTLSENVWEYVYVVLTEQLRGRTYASFDKAEVQQWIEFHAYYHATDEEIRQGKNAERLRKILENNPTNKE